MELTLDQALQKGVEAHKAGKVEEADRFYTAILKASPKHSDANHNMGVLAVGVGKVEAALPFFKTALEVNPNIAQYWLSFIDALIKLDRMADAKAVFDQAKSNGAQGDGFDQLEKRLFRSKRIDNDQTDEKILGKALELRESGKYDEAIDLLLNQTNELSTDTNILSVLSHCYILNDNLEQAKIYLDAAKDINPDIASVGWNQTRIFLKQNKVNEALAIADKTNKLFPDDIEGMAVFGSCLRVNSRFDESLKYLNKAIELNPNYAEALINRGLIYLNKKDKANALTDLEKAYHLKPHIKQIWDLLTDLIVEAKNYSKAIFVLIKMIEVDPSHERSFLLLAFCNQKADDPSLAIISCEKVLEIRPNDAVNYLNLGIAFHRQGKLEEAIEAFNKAISIKPDYAKAYNNTGNTFSDLGKLEEAMEAFKKALSIKPDFAQAYYNMGNVLQEQGKLEEAIEAYKKALSIKPTYADACYNMGIALNKQGKLEEEIEAYTNTLLIEPDYQKAYNNMGNALKLHGKLDEAIEAYKKAISIKPDYNEAFSNIGNALQEQGKLDEAIEAYDKALYIKPDYSKTILDASILRNQISDTALINEEFEKRLEIHSLELITMPNFEIHQAVRAFLLSDPKLVRKHLNSYRGFTPSSIAKLEPEDQVFCSAYNDFLQKLIETPLINEKNFVDYPTVFHLGESHCLSYAHRLIKIHGIDYNVVPRITFGGKAYHFSTQKENAFKAITQANFDSLPNGSKVFVSFGEIDCRSNEGFISASAKHKKPIEDLVSDTVRGYVDWFAEQNQNKSHNLYFFNVPAPIYNEIYPPEVNEEVKSTTKLFNSLLNKVILDYDFNIIDAFKFTVGHDGFSNGLFHIDSYHISSIAIPEIEKQIGP